MPSSFIFAPAPTLAPPFPPAIESIASTEQRAASVGSQPQLGRLHHNALSVMEQGRGRPRTSMS